MNGLYIQQRALDHISRDRSLTDAQVIERGRVMTQALNPDTAPDAEFAEYLDLMRKDQPSIPE